MAFSMEKGNLYQGDNIHGAENIYKEKRDRVFDNIISEGMATQNPKAREDYRARLREKIKEGFIDREYLSKHGWNEDRVLITSEIVDFLIPQIKPNTEEEKIEPIIKQIDGVILPTENGNGPEAGNGVGMAEKRLIPRFELLVNFLKENKITEDNYLCYRGGNEKDMMRQESYVMFVIPDLKKMVLTCDEEGNATYIIHNAPTKKEFEKLKRNEEVAESERSPSFYYKMTKNDLLFLIKELGIVSSKKWDEEKWLEKIEDELTKEVNFAFKAEDIKKLLEQAKNQKNIEKSALEPVPPGWLTNQTLADQLGVNFLTVRRAADKYNRINTEWFKFFLDVNNKAYNYYSPELVALIKKELTKYEPAPSGWLTNSGLAHKIGVTNKKVKPIADRYLGDNKDWSKLYLDSIRKVHLHYSPELVELITKELAKYESMPPGWVANKNLATLLNKSEYMVKRAATRHLKTNKDWSKEYMDNRGRVFSFYSPELAEILKKELMKYETAPPGWLTNNKLAEQLGATFESVKNIASKYIKKNQKLVKLYLDKGGMSCHHYSPELVELIIKELIKQEPAPPGWLTVHGVAAKLAIDRKTVKRITEKHLKIDRDQIRLFKAETGKIYDYYSPELIAKIKQDLLKSKADGKIAP